MNYNTEESKVDFRHRTFEDVLDTDISRASIPAQDKNIDKARRRYPYSIVWTAIPGLTTALPFIGHVGICTYKIKEREGKLMILIGEMVRYMIFQRHILKVLG